MKIEVNENYGVLEVIAEYNPDFLKQFKIKIPKNLRRWDSDKKLWKVDKQAQSELNSLVSQFTGSGVQTDTKNTKSEIQANSEVLEVLKQIRNEIRELKIMKREETIIKEPNFKGYADEKKD